MSVISRYAVDFRLRESVKDKPYFKGQSCPKGLHWSHWFSAETLTCWTYFKNFFWVWNQVSKRAYIKKGSGFNIIIETDWWTVGDWTTTKQGGISFVHGTFKFLNWQWWRQVSSPRTYDYMYGKYCYRVSKGVNPYLSEFGLSYLKWIWQLATEILTFCPLSKMCVKRHPMHCF